ncbi:fatty acyl-CoA synthetase [Patulibacter minatonensis]|uniref:fatty acyl-CoA synthetase n=1 Tax=Patulibacter minatonensis TaxID=298163 RepID=UPI0004799418|nr:fatty acyl-CoA synthetase [Patulibacter minatonensis]
MSSTASSTTASSPDLERIVARARRQTLGDLLHRSARRFPDRPAVVEAGVPDPRRRTFAELDADADRIAAALDARGIGPGDRVALLARNGLPYVQVIFGVARAGAVLVPANFMLGGTEVAYVLEHSGAVGLIAQDALLATADEAVGIAGVADRLRVRAVIDADGDRDGSEPFAALLEGSPGHDGPWGEDLVIASDAPAQVLYTSGTESRPKGAVLSHESLITNYSTCIIDGEMHVSDVQVHALPLFHCAQQHVFLVPAIQLGMTSILLGAPDPATVLRTIEEHGATTFFAPPTIWIGLLRHPDFDTRDLSTLTKGYYGAAIMPVEVLRELSRRRPELRLWNFYGQTEMAPLATVLRPEDQLRKAGSAGRAATNVEARIAAPDGSELPAGEVGEIVLRSPHAILEYLEAPDRTAAAFAGGWFHSGDLGVADDEGYITVVDRIKDMIKTGGENVASREVEEAIYEHPAVAEVAVVGLSHPEWIEAVVAIVVLRDGEQADAEALRVHARERLAGFKVPKAFRVIDALPKNASGKILKRDLRERFADVADEIAGPR